MMRSPGREVLVGGRQPAPDGLDHRLQVGAGLAPAPSRARPRRSRATRAAPGRARLHARAERDRAVEDVARPGSSRRPGRGRAGRRPRAPAAARRSSGRRRRAPRPPPTRPRPARRSSDTSAPSSSRPSVDRKPASGASMPSFSWAAVMLKPTFQPIGSAPCASSSRRRTSIAPRGRARPLTGVITILSASRRS